MQAIHWSFHALDQPAPIRGVVEVPGDKSISHRAVMLGAIAQGITTVQGFLPGEDTRATAQIMQALGADIQFECATTLSITGVGLHGLNGSVRALDCGNAGTAMRLLCGLLAGQRFDSLLIGDASLTKRPMQRVMGPLRSMGAVIESADGGVPPLKIIGGQPLSGIDFETPVASAQIKSAVLLAGLYAQGRTTVRESRTTRDYTERMLEQMGWPIDYGAGYATLTGGHQLTGTSIQVPGDFSSAAFVIVAATLIPGSELTIRNVGIHPTRTGLIRALQLMGADITLQNERQAGSESVANLVVRAAPLHGAQIPVEWVPDMIDEFPVLFVAASLAQGTTIIKGAAELRVKESDRIEAMAIGLSAMGVDIETTPDGAIIRGGGVLKAATIQTHGDHRIAMSFAILAMALGQNLQIRDVGHVATSFPGFAERIAELGAQLEISST